MFNWRAHERPINDMLHYDHTVWSCANDCKVKVRFILFCYLLFSASKSVLSCFKLTDMEERKHSTKRLYAQGSRCQWVNFLLTSGDCCEFDMCIEFASVPFNTMY